ncbi:MAG: glutamate--tRNA ligase [Patescibacteria group bacterium]
MSDNIRVRLAPSPSGPLHIGTAHTALFNWLFARQKDGKFILRIEDTDKARSKEKYLRDIADGLCWLGLDWDEGPEREDHFGPYLQSKRLKIYQKYTENLLENKKAYQCYCTPKELEEERKSQFAQKKPPKYSGRCRNLSAEEIQQFQKEGRKHSVRFIVTTQKISFKDLIKGKVEFESSLFGDFIILKSDGTPTFMFAGVVDDYLMKISHVIRGEDHLSNTPKQILLAEALNFSQPEYGHLPLILNPDRSKLSKRKNPTSINADFRLQGYLPEAIINFLVLMGWSPAKGEEFWTLEELITEFDLSQVGMSPSIFDSEKLDYLNGYYIRQLSLGELARVSLPYIKKEYQKEKKKILVGLSLIQERLKKLSEISEQIDFIFQAPENFQKNLVAKGSTKEKTKLALKTSLKYLQQEEEFGRDGLEQLLRAIAVKHRLTAGELLWPIRVALTGKVASPGAFEVLEALGKQESLKRIQKAIDMIQ